MQMEPQKTLSVHTAQNQQILPLASDNPAKDAGTAEKAHTVGQSIITEASVPHSESHVPRSPQKRNRETDQENTQTDSEGFRTPEPRKARKRHPHASPNMNSSSTGASPLFLRLNVTSPPQANAVKKTVDRRHIFPRPLLDLNQASGNTTEEAQNPASPKENEHTQLQGEIQEIEAKLQSGDCTQSEISDLISKVDKFSFSMRKELKYEDASDSKYIYYAVKILDLIHLAKGKLNDSEIKELIAEAKKFSNILLASMSKDQKNKLLDTIKHESHYQLHRDIFFEKFFTDVHTPHTTPERKNYRWRSEEDVLKGAHKRLLAELKIHPGSVPHKNALERIEKMQRLNKDGIYIGLNRSYHCCKSPEDAASILQNGISVTSESKFKGAFVSDRLQFDFGDFALSVDTNNLAKMKDSITRQERRRLDYGDGGGLWSGFKESVPVEKDLIIYNDTSENSDENLKTLQKLLADNGIQDCEPIARSEWEILQKAIKKESRHQPQNLFADTSPQKSHGSIRDHR